MGIESKHCRFRNLHVMVEMMPNLALGQKEPIGYTEVCLNRDRGERCPRKCRLIPLARGKEDPFEPGPEPCAAAATEAPASGGE